MRTDITMIGFAYYRLSNEESQVNESSSISSQRMLVRDYCKKNGITLIKEFVDDGYSGSNFERPAFRDMMVQIKENKVNTILTKDLSRLGRNMVEASYYAEQYFPEHGIRYIATHDNFDSTIENIMAPFQFAMNEVYLRDGSRKIRNVLQSKREHGEYCACPPYGYRKNPNDKSRLTPDENTASIVERIFNDAAKGKSSRQIAIELTEDGIVPPLKYRVLYRDNFSEKGAERISDAWNNTTVKRILKNQVYLGHTLLGKTKKASIKSSKKVHLPKDKWNYIQNTHPALTTQEIFDSAQKNLGKGTKDFRQYDHVRKSIFSGLVFCKLCGHALCSAGTVYKGEREKYWYLSCTHKRRDVSNPCKGTSIKYSNLIEQILQELNSIISLSDEEKEALIKEGIDNYDRDKKDQLIKSQAEKAKNRISAIDKIIVKLYNDNAEGKIDDDRLARMVESLSEESQGLNKIIESSKKQIDDTIKKEDDYKRFFNLVEHYLSIEELDVDILRTFIERIEIGEKRFPDGYKKATHHNTPYSQEIIIYYKFIGELNVSKTAIA